MIDKTLKENSKEQKYTLAIIGAGPRSVYVLERLASNLALFRIGAKLEIFVFEKSGLFGDGEIHSRYQSQTSYLNRISEEFAFAADDPLADLVPLRAKSERINLYEWCKDQVLYSDDSNFNLQPESWPKRYVHGTALHNQFRKYLSEINAEENIEVQLISEEVIDIEQIDEKCLKVSSTQQVKFVDEILLITGHSKNTPNSSPIISKTCANETWMKEYFVASPYPLNNNFPTSKDYTEKNIVCAGMGLTTIDVILHLTEGRGGSFKRKEDRSLSYISSGKEPNAIYCYSRSGSFPLSRPSYKSRSDTAFSIESGKFFSRKSIDRLKKSNEESSLISNKLDFVRDVLPIIVIEMAYVHYQVLYGLTAVSSVLEGFELDFRRFLKDPSLRITTDVLLDLFEQRIDLIRKGLSQFALSSYSQRDLMQKKFTWTLQDSLQTWAQVVYQKNCEQTLDRAFYLKGKELINRFSFLDQDVELNRFDWSFLSNVSSQWNGLNSSELQTKLVSFLEKDLVWAKHGVGVSPVKSACDLVWRELRSVILYTVEEGGLTPASHSQFDSEIISLHNRLANGVAPEVIEKLLSLIKAGKVINLGSNPKLLIDPSSDKFEVVTSAGEQIRGCLLVDSRQAQFNIDSDCAPLYRNMKNRGLVQNWKNIDGSNEYIPGGLDLDSHNHPIGPSGKINRNITILGPVSEGARALRFSAFRPHANHYVMNEIIHWKNGFIRRLMNFHNSQQSDSA